MALSAVDARLSFLTLPVASCPEWERRLVRVLTGMFFLGLSVILAAPFFSGSSWLIFVQDDFLYYLKVAQNIAQGRGSTFNGIVPTNGYQPLWLLILVAFSWITQNQHLVVAFLAMSTFVAAVITFLLARRLLRSTGIRPLLIFSMAAWTTLYAVTLFFYGMEVTLTVPIILGVINLLLNVTWLERSSVHTLLLGLLVSAMVLSRIDTLIFGGLVLVGILFHPKLRKLLRIKLVVGAMLGLVPLLLYFLFNYVLFQTWLPVSGMAKELRLDHGPSVEPWRVFLHPLAAFLGAILLFAFVLLPVIKRELSPMAQVVFPAVLTFPFVYYFILSWVSDWTLWGWYMYPIRSAVCISFLIFCLWRPLSRLLQTSVVLCFLLFTVFTCLGLLRWTRQQTDIYAATLDIQKFARTHPGVYAMGDRAGRVGYLLPDPVIQTEGLMMDREYLEYVRRQRPLRETLAHYKVRYYIATAYQPFTGCFMANEPAKAGPNSAHMRSEFCEQPQASYVHDGVETLIFDLGQSRQ